MPPAYLKGPTLQGLGHANGCTGKIAYASQAEAKKLCGRIKHKIYFYRCLHCNRWHTSRSRHKYYLEVK